MKLKPEQRQLYLKIGVAVAGVLFLLDWLVIGPAFQSWEDQGKRITALRAQVKDGQTLLGREKNLRERWAGMLHENLPPENSAAENVAFKAVARWARDAGVTFTSLTKQPWKPHDEGYDTLEFNIALNGSQTSIGHFIYEMQNDSIPVNLVKWELSTRDARGTQLSLVATFSFLRLPEKEKTIR